MAKRPTSYYDQPTITPEQALPALRKQAEELNTMCGKTKTEVGSEENSWAELTESIIIRAFGKDSHQHENFIATDRAGRPSSFVIPARGFGPTPAQREAESQSYFASRCERRKATLKAQVLELELLLPTKATQGVYGAGDSFAFYGDLAPILRNAQTLAFVCDPYLSNIVFDTYLSQIPKQCDIWALVDTQQFQRTPGMSAVASMFKTSYLKFQLTTSSQLHDRFVAVDNDGWVIGQSIKDAANKKGTYMVQVDKMAFWPAYNSLWNQAQQII